MAEWLEHFASVPLQRIEKWVPFPCSPCRFGHKCQIQKLDWMLNKLKLELRLAHFSFSFYFLLPISRESIFWGSNFRSGDFDGFTRFEVP